MHDQLRSIGTTKYLQGDFQGAKFYYTLAEGINPNSGANLYSMGVICEDMKNLECARNKYIAASKAKDPDAAASAISNLSRIEIFNRNLDTAINLLKPNLDRASNPRINAALYKNLAWAEYIKNDYNQAETHLEKAIELKNQTTEHKEWSAPHCLLAQVLEKQGKKQESIFQWDYCLKYAHYQDRIEEKTWQLQGYQLLNKSEKLK